MKNYENLKNIVENKSISSNFKKIINTITKIANKYSVVVDSYKENFNYTIECDYKENNKQIETFKKELKKHFPDIEIRSNNYRDYIALTLDIPLPQFLNESKFKSTAIAIEKELKKLIIPNESEPKSYRDYNIKRQVISYGKMFYEISVNVDINTVTDEKQQYRVYSDLAKKLKKELYLKYDISKYEVKTMYNTIIKQEKNEKIYDVLIEGGLGAWVTIIVKSPWFSNKK